MSIKKGHQLELEGGVKYLVVEAIECTENYLCLANLRDEKDVKICREAQTELGLKVVPIEEALLLNQLAKKFKKIVMDQTDGDKK